MKDYTYLILGAGKQGTAAAYDLAINGSAKKIIIADRYRSQAIKSATRVNSLAGSDLTLPEQIDVSDEIALQNLMEQADVALSAVPYYFNLGITRLALKTSTHLCDMGGYTKIAQQQLAFHEAAQQAGISIVPDCGMGPGFINNVAAYAIELLDKPDEIYIFDAGLPKNPKPPWNYELTFHINGLTNEMDGQAVFLRDGEITYVDTLTEPEFMDVPPFGLLEADVTSGGTSTAPWTFKGIVRNYENKVFRLPGHYEWLRAYKALGLFGLEPVDVHGQQIVPREVYHTLLEPKITEESVQDVGIIRVKALGEKEGKQTTLFIDLVDYADEKTGFTAMERLTGWHCSIMMINQANGTIKPGAVPLEIAISPGLVMQSFAERGIPHTVRYEY
jgi:lysine 6-dehydrogenase